MRDGCEAGRQWVSGFSCSLLSLSLSSPIKYKASGHGYNRLLLSCIFLKDVEILIQYLWPYLEIGSWQMVELDEVIGGGVNSI